MTKLLQKINVPFVHLVGMYKVFRFSKLISYLSLSPSIIAQMPANFRTKKVKPRGVSNRNRGLEWIRANASEGVFYFADDDNTYDVEIFDEVSANIA